MQRQHEGGRRLVVMARWPAPGRCKSRLARGGDGGAAGGWGIGALRAAAVQRRLGDHALAAARQTRQQLPLELVLAGSGASGRMLRRWGQQQGCDQSLEQGGGGLGLRLQRQLVLARRRRIRQLVLVGSDLPQLEALDLQVAFAALEQRPLVLGPAEDGGYWLIGLQPCSHLPLQRLFCGIPWGSDAVLEATRQAALQLGLAPLELAVRRDLDRPADLSHWR